MAVTGLLQQVRATLPTSPEPSHRRDPGHRHRSSQAPAPQGPISWVASSASPGAANKLLPTSRGAEEPGIIPA